MLSLIIVCAVAIAAIAVVLSILFAILSLPFMLLTSALPWLLAIAGVVLLVKAILARPIHWENFMPAVVAFLLSGLIRWIF